MTELKLSLIMLSAPFVAVYALVQILASHDLYRNVRDDARTATAVVERIEEATFLGFATRGRMVSYALRLSDRSVIRGAARVAHADAGAYRAGDTISIVYAEHAPQHSSLSVAHAWQALVSNLVAAGAYLCVLAFTFYAWRTSPRRSYRLPAP